MKIILITELSLGAQSDVTVDSPAIDCDTGDIVSSCGTAFYTARTRMMRGHLITIINQFVRPPGERV